MTDSEHGCVLPLCEWVGVFQRLVVLFGPTAQSTYPMSLIMLGTNVVYRVSYVYASNHLLLHKLLTTSIFPNYSHIDNQ